MRKTRRRADDYFYFASEGERSYPWTASRRTGLVRFAASTVLVAPLVIDVLRGMRRTRDAAWWFHIPACWATLAIYAAATIRSRISPKMLDRRGWRS
jgi:hypothetical protein